MHPASYYHKHYPQVAHALVDVQKVVSTLPLHADVKAQRGSFELEGRLGRIQYNGHKEIFVPGVSPGFFQKCLHRMSQFTEWETVTPWGQTQECFHTLPASSDDLPDHKVIVRSSSAFTKVGDNTVCSVSHVSKQLFGKKDFRFTTTKPVSDDVRYDLRIALNYEEPIPIEFIPQSVAETNHVRVKIRKTFHYRSGRTPESKWKYDFTQSWSAATFSEADRKQKMGIDTCYEVEIECDSPYTYLNSPSQDQLSLALSMLVKLSDLIGKEHPFQWV